MLTLVGISQNRQIAPYTSWNYKRILFFSISFYAPKMANISFLYYRLILTQWDLQRRQANIDWAKKISPGYNNNNNNLFLLSYTTFMNEKSEKICIRFSNRE